VNDAFAKSKWREAPDYRDPLLNKVPAGFSMKAAQDIIDGKPIDAIDSANIFTTGLIAIKQ